MTAATTESWLDSDLQPWMESIYPVLDEEVWLGPADQEAGVIDLLLLADAVGLSAYSWDLPVGISPFRRLDVVASFTARIWYSPGSRVDVRRAPDPRRVAAAGLPL